LGICGKIGKGAWLEFAPRAAEHEDPNIEAIFDLIAKKSRTRLPLGDGLQAHGIIFNGGPSPN
jgi:hypothetical protein